MALLRRTRVPLLAANWKMNKTVGEALEYAGAFLGLLDSAKSPAIPEMLICPPFTSLPALCSVFTGTEVKVGAQNLFWAPKGAYTGEVSASMLADLGCSHVIVGHSERRHVFGETGFAVGKKVRAALDAGLTPILCVGETSEEREAGSALAVCDTMTREGLKEVGAREISRVVIAYEPVWAIGTGKEARPDDAQEVIAGIRASLESLFEGAAGEVRILYGGSVNSSNIRGFMGRGAVDGALVGGASLDPVEFTKIISAARKVKE